MATPLVSVIIPVYNPPIERLSACLESVLGQYGVDKQVVLVDDGSVREIAAFLDEIAKEFSEAVVIHQDNSGASAARNRGVKASKGDYIMFVDADDELLPGAIAQGLDACQQAGADIAFGLVKSISSESERRQLNIKCELGASYQVVSVDELMRHHLVGRSRFGSVFKNSCGVVKNGPIARLLQRDLALSVSFPEEVKVSEDTVWNVAVLQKCKLAIVVNDCWYLYWLLNRSSVHRYREECDEEAIAALAAVRSCLGKTGLKRYRNEYVARCVGEMNRVAKTYSRPDCPLSFRKERINLNKVYRDSLGSLESRSIADYCAYPNITAKQYLCKTGLNITLFSMLSQLRSIANRKKNLAS